MTVAVLGLGGNIGDTRKLLADALVALAAHPDIRVVAVSILEIERDLGRERTERWGPRTVDIDILLFGTGPVDEPGLHIPHPHLPERAFALAPLIDVMPEAEFSGRPAREWLEAADRSGMVRQAEPGWATRGDTSE